MKYTYSFLSGRNMSPVVLFGAEFDRDIQNWAKLLGMGQTGAPTRKIKFKTLPGFQLTGVTRMLGKFSCCDVVFFVVITVCYFAYKNYCWRTNSVVKRKGFLAADPETSPKSR